MNECYIREVDSQQYPEYSARIAAEFQRRADEGEGKAIETDTIMALQIL